MMWSFGAPVLRGSRRYAELAAEARQRETACPCRLVVKVPSHTCSPRGLSTREGDGAIAADQGAILGQAI